MKKRILVCDDEEGTRESVKLIREKEFELLFASNYIVKPFTRAELLSATKKLLPLQEHFSR